jgi:hypothetical protein
MRGESSLARAIATQGQVLGDRLWLGSVPGFRFRLRTALAAVLLEALLEQGHDIHDLGRCRCASSGGRRQFLATGRYLLLDDSHWRVDSRLDRTPSGGLTASV